MATIQERGRIEPRHFATPVFETAPDELREILERAAEEVFVVDIQDPETFDAGHIPGARNVHLEDLLAECEELPKARTIVIYCGDVSCGLPLWAALELARAGYSAKYLHGGLDEWRQLAYPVEISPPAPDPEF